MLAVSICPSSLARTRTAIKTTLSVGTGICVLILAGSVQAQQFPDCVSASSDADGDGWGWENNRSCVVVEGKSSPSGADPEPATAGASFFPACRSNATDPDGDGYGYEDGRSCLVQLEQPHPDQTQPDQTQADQTQADQIQSGLVQSDPVQPDQGQSAQRSSHPLCSDSSSDPDGDGYGWENNTSCIVSADTTSSESVETVTPKVSAAQAGNITIDSVTDVVLVTGQSNVLGANTRFDSNLDEPSEQVFAYTDNGWQVADLHQVWDRFMHPGNLSSSVPGRDPANSFAFHFGKSLVRKDVTRVVAFIVAPAPGQGISAWDSGSAQYRRIQDKVSQALDKIPHKYSLDAVLWHQGESDFLYEGTADANATGFTSEESYEYKNYYQIKLNTLINNFRSEPWGGYQMAFICGETRRGEGVNKRLNALNTDNDALTACVKGSDLPKRADDQIGSHFSAEALRTIGQRYADKYFELSNR